MRADFPTGGGGSEEVAVRFEARAPPISVLFKQLSEVEELHF